MIAWGGITPLICGPHSHKAAGPNWTVGSLCNSRGRHTAAAAATAAAEPARDAVRVSTADSLEQRIKKRALEQQSEYFVKY